MCAESGVLHRRLSVAVENNTSKGARINRLFARKSWMSQMKKLPSSLKKMRQSRVEVPFHIAVTNASIEKCQNRCFTIVKQHVRHRHQRSEPDRRSGSSTVQKARRWRTPALMVYKHRWHIAVLVEVRSTCYRRQKKAPEKPAARKT